MTQQFKKILEEEKNKLEAEMQSIGRRNPAVPDDWESLPSEIGTEADIIDQADVVVSRETNAAVLADLEARYDMTLTALKRIEDGTYGRCEVCNKRIKNDRLLANPAATTCAVHMR